uniref:RRM domain-containing protein n=1 Tax=Rhizophora mucronata TaxID=61149 RepID=A0A2P2LE60_RHIMU
MEVEKAKVFVGGISRETSEDVLRAHFSKYGDVLGSLVAKDRAAGNPRGFGFVWFSDPSFADQALQDTHVILGRRVCSSSLLLFFVLFLCSSALKILCNCIT